MTITALDVSTACAMQATWLGMGAPR